MSGEAGDATGAGTLGSLGEGEVLARILPRLPRGEATLIGPGDDAAVVRAADGRVVVTTDTMIHGPDFRLAWSSPRELGWKAAATNLADVAAMGARPTALVVALTAPAATPVEVLEGIAEGLREGCEALAPGCGVVGGDLSVSATLTLAVTAFGDLEGREPVLRSGARVGDVVAVSGPLGDAGHGIRLLFAEAVDAGGEPSAELAAALREREPRALAAQLAPSPPIGAGVAAAEAGATAMLDVSDGLLLDARRIARASGVRFELDGAAVAAGAPSLALALTGGEDHALLAAFPPGSVPSAFRAIGRVAAGEGVAVDGVPADERGGWDPYADWDGAAG
ncbi:thiamine-phosphate kinase [Homoserinibacter sp. YIM 151385]|uniref:thiamine-phosphate kinase n=1 Tax=Homoserinibacter sp. YIM 151385 TaxID=2985506 RepID=UPI0022F00992|nr:thiamine-phosphate kinase [Homoserinibacter sp. YIM 151385]WBU39217.1 thiamine-phosphate kinase [Homoserinibacter sp. YIM 151385]